ncbi:hypothetical protein ACLOJK_009473 [Asimina triloba]
MQLTPHRWETTYDDDDGDDDDNDDDDDGGDLVLDNLPHDLIFSKNQVSPWMEVWLEKKHDSVSLNMQQLLEVLQSALPKMSLIASDFSYLPDVKISGERAPLVSTKGDADIFFPTDFWLLERIDHFCSGWSNQNPDSKSSNSVKRRRTITLDTAAFMEEFGLPSKTRTKDGYNPLLDDFKNTKFYLSVPTHNINGGKGISYLGMGSWAGKCPCLIWQLRKVVAAFTDSVELREAALWCVIH